MINPQRKIHSYNNPKNIEMKQELCPQLRGGIAPSYYKSIVNFDFLEWVVYIYILQLEVVIITILNHARRIRMVESYLLFYDLIGSTIKRSNLSYIYTQYITLASYSSRHLFSKFCCKLFRNRKLHCKVIWEFGKKMFRNIKLNSNIFKIQ